MIDKRETMNHNAEMAEHADGAAQLMESLVGGCFLTKEQVHETMNFLMASTKRTLRVVVMRVNWKKKQRFAVESS